MHLLESHLLTEDQLKIAQIERTRTHKRFEKIVVDLGFISEKTLSTFISERSGIAVFSLEKTAIDSSARTLLSKEFCEHHKVIPLSFDQGILGLAMVDIHDVLALDEIRKKIPYRGLRPLVATETDLLKAIDLYFGYEMSIEGLLRAFTEGGSLPKASIPTHEEDFSPTIHLVNAFILDAVKKNASDIHFEPEENFLRIRYRLDGLLVVVRTLHISYWEPLCVRLKIMASMDIANARLPQNGRFSLSLGAREVDFRVSSQPIVHGENIVVRILDKTHSLVPLEALGYGEENVRLLKRLLKTPSGLIIITGPTGSGKTTSLYSMLNVLNTPSVNIMTLEAPVEYQLPWIRQTDIKEKDALTFAQGVRAILRQDPDIILVGEVRDEDTASMALRAAMTGHQVLTTLHTNDVFGVVYRLQDLGLEASILAGNMIGALAQRLIRKLCPHCKKPHTLNATSIPESATFYAAGGCEICHFTGYLGRTAVVEVLPFNETLNDLISLKGTRADFKRVARENGFVSMTEHGLSLVTEGVTSLEEFERVLGVHT